MQLEVSANKNFAKVSSKVTMPNHSRAYTLCVKADALIEFKYFGVRFLCKTTAPQIRHGSPFSFWGSGVTAP